MRACLLPVCKLRGPGLRVARAQTTGYVEYPAVRSRLLMGTAAWKHKVDMYLYYELGSWSPFFSVGGYQP